ncbi:hypothetical protein [Massilia putida]|uniref:hypothetical protein n=1 Tax=Massilia putida TaxID=1141883 RepID=UPI00095316B9|nr:hypothetical protein [Massilia putida]
MKAIALTLLTLPLAVSIAHAQDTSPVRITGFGTGALTWTDTDGAEYSRPNQASGAKKNPVTGVDSNLGLQAYYAVNSWLSVTAQGLVRKDAEDDFGAELTWAFAKAKLSDDVGVRVGRLGVPVFMISDYRNVGYANTFLRAPEELYSQVPYKDIDGADITWQHSYGDTTYTAQFAYGRSKADLSGGLTVDSRRVGALNLVAEHGPLTLRLGRAEAHRTTVYDAPTHTSRPSAGHGTFTSAGIGLDWNNIVAQSEYAKRKTGGVAPSKAWYVMGGYRFGKVLPYFTHSELRSEGAVANIAALPTAVAARLSQINNATGAGEQTTDSVGVRWDFYRSLALKVQFDRVRPNGTGLLLNPKTGFHGPVTVGAVALDFVF